MELLAYAADNLSYRQDAMANEAYLATARKRVSVRRHARLVDYALHEGCNARAFVHVEVANSVSLPKGSSLLTSQPGLPAQIVEADPLQRTKIVSDAMARGAVVFESAHDARLEQEQNRLFFYTWGDRGCCLPRGTTRATLRGHISSLEVGDILLFEELRSPSPATQFAEADRDPSHRCAVRLTKVSFEVDPSGQLFDLPPIDGPLAITEIEWSAEDALPFPLCLSVVEQPELVISVARGNIVLADQGAWVAVDLEPARALRFRPLLAHRPLTHAFDLERTAGAGCE